MTFSLPPLHLIHERWSYRDAVAITPCESSGVWYKGIGNIRLSAFDSFGALDFSVLCLLSRVPII